MMLPNELNFSIRARIKNKISEKLILKSKLGIKQYHPAFRVKEFPPLDRRPWSSEYEAAVAAACVVGLRRLV
jgi:uncharacterized Fe-S radical SAM superfamily protein PflX